MFDFDGNIQSAEPAETATSEELAQEKELQPEVPQEMNQDIEQGAAQQIAQDSAQETKFEPENDPSSGLSDSELEHSFDEPLGFDQQQDLPPTSSPQETFEDVAAYGNQETQAGAIHYEVRVSEINSGDMRDEVIGRLAQPRFGFSARDIEGLIQDGEIVLSKLNPAQAVLMVGALRDLDVVVRWKQGLYEV